MKIKILIAAAAASLFLAGCSIPTRWVWNGYRDHLYDYNAQEISEEELLGYLLEAVDEAEKEKGQIAPGLLAEIGTLYARAGKYDLARRYYELEREAWPDSRVLMTALIEGLGRIEANRNGREEP